MKNNKKLKDHMVPLRKIMEGDIAQHLYDAQESQSQVELQLTELKNALPAGSTGEKAAFKAMISLVKNATPESIGHLKLFTKALTSLTEHMANYSENMNPKLRQSRALKNVLDEMFTEAVDELGLPVSTISLQPMVVEKELYPMLLVQVPRNQRLKVMDGSPTFSVPRKMMQLFFKLWTTILTVS
jgi:hypothetical protein